MRIDNEEKIPEDAENFKAPVENPDIFSDSAIKNTIIERRKSEIGAIENRLVKIKEKIEEASQKQWSCKTFTERKLVEDRVRELGAEESSLEYELIKVNDKNRQPAGQEEIIKTRLELKTAKEKNEQAIVGKPIEQKAEQKIEEFISQIREDKLTLEEKEKIVEERLKGMLDPKIGAPKAGLADDFERLRVFFVEIKNQKPKKEKAAVESKEEKPLVAAEKPVEKIIIETESKDTLANDVKEKINKSKPSEANAPKEEKKTMTPDEMKAKREEVKKERERLRAEREEQERKRRLLVEFIKTKEEEFKQIWFNLREKSNKLEGISAIIRKEEEQIERILAQDRVENAAFDLKLDFLKNENLMNDEKKDIAHILKEDGLTKENIEIVKDTLKELVIKYENYKIKIARIHKDKSKITGSMDSVFSEIKDISIVDAVPDHNVKDEAVSGEEFENLDKTIENTEKEIEAEIAKLKLSPVEVK